MNLGSYSRVTFGIAAFILIVSGYNDLALQSAASSSWDSESSLLVINVRSRGMLKIALGLGALGLTLLGVGVPDESNPGVGDRPAAANTPKGFVEASSDPSTNFSACCELYKREGGSGDPDFEKSSINFATIYLKDKSGKKLATLIKTPKTGTSLGKWELLWKKEADSVKQ